LQNNCSASRRLLINTLGTLYQHSRLYQQLDPLVVAYQPRRIFGKGFSNSFWALYLPDDEAALEQSWQVTQGIFGQLEKEVEADGARFAVAFFPWSVVIELSTFAPEQQQTLLVSENPAFASMELDRPNRRLAQFLSGQDIPFIDLTGPLVEQQQARPTSLHFVGDGHWTVEGSHFVAETLGQWLIQAKLLPE
jgi:hypothetical protein